MTNMFFGALWQRACFDVTEHIPWIESCSRVIAVVRGFSGSLFIHLCTLLFTIWLMDLCVCVLLCVTVYMYVCVGVNTGVHMLMCGSIKYSSVRACVCVSAAWGKEWTAATDKHSHSGRPLWSHRFQQQAGHWPWSRRCSICANVSSHEGPLSTKHN